MFVEMIVLENLMRVNEIQQSNDSHKTKTIRLFSLMFKLRLSSPINNNMPSKMSYSSKTHIHIVPVLQSWVLIRLEKWATVKESVQLLAYKQMKTQNHFYC